MQKAVQHPAYGNIRRAIEDTVSTIDPEDQARLVLRMIDKQRAARRPGSVQRKR